MKAIHQIVRDQGLIPWETLPKTRIVGLERGFVNKIYGWNDSGFKALESFIGWVEGDAVGKELDAKKSKKKKNSLMFKTKNNETVWVKLIPDGPEKVPMAILKRPNFLSEFECKNIQRAKAMYINLLYYRLKKNDATIERYFDDSFFTTFMNKCGDCLKIVVERLPEELPTKKALTNEEQIINRLSLERGPFNLLNIWAILFQNAGLDLNGKNVRILAFDEEDRMDEEESFKELLEILVKDGLLQSYKFKARICKDKYVMFIRQLINGEYSDSTEFEGLTTDEERIFFEENIEFVAYQERSMQDSKLLERKIASKGETYENI